jgi:hypothetical protein
MQHVGCTFRVGLAKLNKAIREFLPDSGDDGVNRRDYEQTTTPERLGASHQFTWTGSINYVLCDNGRLRKWVSRALRRAVRANVGARNHILGVETHDVSGNGH